MQSKQKKSKKEQDPNAPQDQDIIDAIKESSEKNLKPTFVYLNKLNNEMINNKEEIFHNEYLALKSKYEEKYFALYQKTKDIALDHISYEIDDKDYETYNIDKEKAKENKPISQFYLSTLLKADFFTISEKDKPILEKLIDIRIIPLENKVDFRVEFEFEPNDYFTDKVISKTYTFDPKTEQIKKATATDIDWKSDEMNPGYKKVTKKIKKKKSIETQTIEKHVDTFFDIFDEERMKSDKDYIEARFLKEDFFPNMLEYFMGITNMIDDECQEHDCHCCSHKK